MTGPGSGAAPAQPVPLDLDLEIAGHALRLTAGAAAGAAVGPALCHLAARPSPGADPRDATPWRCWESAAPHPLWRGDAPGPGRLDRTGLVVTRPDPPVVEAFDTLARLEMWGAPGALAGGDVRAHPASTALAAWLATRDVQVLHAAAVAYDGRAALVLGPGGTGKSTTALACLHDGADYLGDDLTAIEIAPTPTVHALYATAKLTPDADRALSLHAWPTLGETPKGKRVVAVADADALARRARVEALVFLDPPAAQVAGPRRLPRRAVVRALAPTALKAGLGAGSLAQWLTAAATLAREVPAWAITPSWDLVALARAVRVAVERSTTEHG